MTKKEFTSRMDVAERQAGSPLWGVVYSVFTGGIATLLFMGYFMLPALSAGPYRWDFIALALKTFAPASLLLLGSLPLADWVFRRGIRRMGLECPKCRTLLFGQSGERTAATGLCGTCGTRIFDPEAAPAGPAAPGVCIGCGRSLTAGTAVVNGFDVCRACIEPRNVPPEPSLGENYPPYWWGAAMGACFFGALGAGVAAGLLIDRLFGLRASGAAAGVGAVLGLAAFVLRLRPVTERLDLRWKRKTAVLLGLSHLPLERFSLAVLLDERRSPWPKDVGLLAETRGALVFFGRERGAAVLPFTDLRGSPSTDGFSGARWTRLDLRDGSFRWLLIRETGESAGGLSGTTEGCAKRIRAWFCESARAKAEAGTQPVTPGSEEPVDATALQTREERKAEMALNELTAAWKNVRESWPLVGFSSAFCIWFFSPGLYRRFGFWPTAAFWPALALGYYWLISRRIRMLKADLARVSRKDAP